MHITHFSTTGVAPDGRVDGGGAVNVEGSTRYSAPEGGCGSRGCNCSPGHWLSVIEPRTPDGVVAGYTAHFDSRAELEAADLEDIDRIAREQGATP